MGCTSSSNADHAKIKVKMSWPGGKKKLEKRIPLSPTMDQLKEKLRAPNSPLGRVHKREAWDNIVENGKQFHCTVQCHKV